MALDPKKEQDRFLRHRRKHGIMLPRQRAGKPPLVGPQPEKAPRAKRPISQGMRDLALLTVELLAKNVSYSDIARKHGITPRRYRAIRSTERFFNLCKEINADFNKYDLIGAYASRRELIRKRHWPATKDVIDREEGPAGGDAEVTGNRSVIIINIGSVDGQPIPDDIRRYYSGLELYEPPADGSECPLPEED